MGLRRRARLRARADRVPRPARSALREVRRERDSTSPPRASRWTITAPPASPTWWRSRSGRRRCASPRCGWRTCCAWATRSSRPARPSTRRSTRTERCAACRRIAERRCWRWWEGPPVPVLRLRVRAADARHLRPVEPDRSRCAPAVTAASAGRQPRTARAARASRRSRPRSDRRGLARREPAGVERTHHHDQVGEIDGLR